LHRVWSDQVKNQRTILECIYEFASPYGTRTDALIPKDIKPLILEPTNLREHEIRVLVAIGDEQVGLVALVGR
jgi:hypothetical protein